MDDTESFRLIFSGLFREGTIINNDERWDINHYPYRLEFKNKYPNTYNPCKYCQMQRCRGCTVPFLSTSTISDVFESLKISSNTSLFEKEASLRNSDLSINVVWNMNIRNELFNFMTTATPFPKREIPDELRHEDVKRGSSENI